MEQLLPLYVIFRKDQNEVGDRSETPAGQMSKNELMRGKRGQVRPPDPEGPSLNVIPQALGNMAVQKKVLYGISF